MFVKIKDRNFIQEYNYWCYSKKLNHTHFSGYISIFDYNFVYCFKTNNGNDDYEMNYKEYYLYFICG